VARTNAIIFLVKFNDDGVKLVLGKERFGAAAVTTNVTSDSIATYPHHVLLKMTYLLAFTMLTILASVIAADANLLKVNFRVIV
jgi:hypothetical protein